MTENPDDKLYYDDVARLRGVSIRTVRTDLAKARTVRENPDNPPAYIAGRQDMPEPDGQFKRSPYWLRSTIMPWIENRALSNQAIAASKRAQS